MLYGTLIVIHLIACLGLIVIVLLQSGRGGGLSESFSSAESIFGTKTNTFLTRTTMIFAILFLITCLTLAFLSKQSSKSIMPGQKVDTKAHPDTAVKDIPEKQSPDQTEQKQNTDKQTAQETQPAK